MNQLNPPQEVKPIVSCGGSIEVGGVCWPKYRTQAELLCEEMNARPGFVGAGFDDHTFPTVNSAKTHRWSESLSLHECHDGSKFVFNSTTRPGKQFSASPDAICWGIDLGDSRCV